MPSSGPRTCTNGPLRDSLVAAPRCSAPPLTTTDLRHGTPQVPMLGGSRLRPPVQERIYRLVRSLRSEGAVASTDTGRRAWMATTVPAVEDDIAALDTLVPAPSATAAQRLSTCDPCRRRR